MTPLEEQSGRRRRRRPPRAEPGQVVALTPDGFVVQTGRGRLLVRRVQPPNAAAMSGRDYVNGYRLEVGQRLSEPDIPA